MKPTPPNPVVHLELHTTDRWRARTFYAELCGWQPERIEAGGGAYDALELGGSLCRGASVLLEPREGPAGWRSVAASPAGGEIAFWQQKR
jgi:predicted enzyme related to lactoylglutathione lyase